MRKILALTVLAAACDGGSSDNPMVDSGTSTPDMFVMPDADTGIDGMWRDTFYTNAGATMTSSCTNAPTALQVDGTSAMVTQYNGVCKPDGSFRIEAPGQLSTPYYLRVQGVLYETDTKKGIDLSTDRLGRSDVAAITGVTLSVSLTNMQAWQTGDIMATFAPNIGFRQNLNFTAGAPTTNDTTISATANWNGYKIESAKSDTLQIFQLGKHTTGNGFDFVSLDRVFTVAPFTMTNNTAQSINGAFGTATAGSTQLNLDVASFTQFAASAAPSVMQKSVQGSVYSAVSTDTIDSPPLISFAQSADNVTSMNFNTLFYSDPFPSSWQRLVKILVGYTVPYTWNSANGTMTAQVVRVMPKATADGTLIQAELGPPLAPKFDNVNAFTATSISAVPLLSWIAPTTGTPSDYEIQVYEAKTNGSSLSFTSVLRLITKQTQLRIPNGYLLGQRQYVFMIRARARTGVDIYDTPLRAGTAWSSADVLTALVTTDS